MSNRTGIRLSPESIKAHIAEVIYEDREVGGHRVITCHFKMDNGFVVWGKNSSTSIDPTNFDVEKGKQLAYDKTFSQLWELEAYRALIERDAKEAATVDAQIDLEQYISERGNFAEVMGGPNFLHGHRQQIMFRHPKDPTKGFYAEFIRSDNNVYDDKVNAESRAKAEAYIRSWLTVEELNSELVVRVAKTCHAAVAGLASDKTKWSQLQESDRKNLCDKVRAIFLEPVDACVHVFDSDRVFRSIVDSYK